ncbi:cytochrome oxidase assembly protein [Duganella sp. CY15W]|uniref:FixH family protein n=1 Tax=Duganella sp. CY15W TaxID=2692172 RepID=UPI0013697FE4|nr:FixH family protein [Duganella sp. CY15W]MYM29332.1 cytochrome oxidase assembly protein [Duganella sp. CY15W]
MNTLAMPVTPWWKQRWPWLLMAGPAIVVVAGTYTAWLATSSADPLVVGDYYKEGKAINQDLRRDRVAAQMGLSVALGYDAANGLLTGRINRKDTGPLMLHLSHATLPEKDIRMVLVPDENGAFSVALPMLERSRWIVLVEGPKRDWRLAGAWKYPVQQGVALLPD